jgi:hypothetical protein
MIGSLSEGVLPGLLRELYVGRKTGTLNFRKGEERRSVRFRRGHIVNADTNVLEDRMGDVLAREGWIQAADLARATEIMSREAKRLGQVLEELGCMDAGRLEDALALQVRTVLLKVFEWNEGQYEFVDEPEGPAIAGTVTLKISTGDLILEAVRRVRDPDVIRYALGNLDRVLALSSDPLLRFQKITLGPTDGFVLSRVDGTVSAREVVQMIPLPPEETLKSLFGLLCTGVVEHAPLPPKPRPAPARPGTAPPPARPAPPPSVKAAPAASPPAAAPPPSAAPSGPAPAPPPAAAPSSAAPAMAPPGAPPSAPANNPSAPPVSAAVEELRRGILDAFDGLKTRTHYEVLGITPPATEAAVKEAYFRLARRFHPDSHHDPSLNDLRNKLEAVFIRLGEAYEVLRNVRTRTGYDETLSRRSQAAASGKGAVGGAQGSAAAVPEQGSGPDPEAERLRGEEAIRRANKAIENEKYWDAIQLLEPAIDVVKGRAHIRARVLMATAYLKNPKWQKRGEEILQSVTRDDPQNVDAFLMLARIYKQQGMRSRSLNMFKKVVQLQPDNEEALAEAPLEESTDASPPSGGIIKKLFGKG